MPDVHNTSGISPFSPQVQFLFFLSRYLPLHLQILEHDHICMIFFRRSYNRTCSLFAKFCVQTFRICPSSRLPVSAQSHVPSGICGSVPQCRGYIRSFSLEVIYESSSRTVPSARMMVQDPPYSVSIPKLHAADDLFFHRCFGKCYFFCIGKNVKNTSGVSFPELGQTPFSLTSVFSDIPYLYAPDVHSTISSHGRHRVSGMLASSPSAPSTVHDITVEDRHGVVFIYKPWFPCSFRLSFPL